MAETKLAAEPSSGAKVADPGGELRFVTVLFADLAGFTAFAEDRAPDDVAKIVGDLLQRLGGVVEQFNGGVDKFLGDAVVATFGLPHPDPNAARNAVRAGLAMQACAGQFNQEQGLNFGLRVGIHAGEVMFRAIGGSWTVMGDTVNTASRIQSAAQPGKVWISRPVYEEVRRYFTLIPRPAVELKGKKQAVQPYEVLDERNVPFASMPRFVGREKEWDQLLKARDRAIEKRGLAVVVVRGLAGIGKSRLVWELRDGIQRQPEVYLVDQVQFDHSERLPSHGLNTLIRNRFQLPVELDEDAVLAGLRERMSAEALITDPAAAELTVELFASVLGVARADFRTAAVGGKNHWESTFIQIKEWLERRAAQTPWVWFLEDAQRGDADTAAFLDWALQVEWSAPVMAVVTVREEDFRPECYWYEPLNRWVQQGLAEEIRLREIPPETLAQAISSMADGEVSQQLAVRIAEHTEGNPLFATEIVLLLKERGQLGDADGWQKISLPGSIREVMEARIERLGLDGKDVAKRGALMGRRFTREAVSRIWDRSPRDLDTGYEALRQTETIYEEASKLFSGEIENVFRHGRLHEAVLARIPREERQRWLKELGSWALDKLRQHDQLWMSAGAVLIPLIARSYEEQGQKFSASLWYEALGFLHLKFYRNQEAALALRKAGETSSGVRRLVLFRRIAETEQFNGQGPAALQALEEALQPAPEVLEDAPAEALERLDALKDNPLDCWNEIDAEDAAIALELMRAYILTQLGKVAEARQVYEQIQVRLPGHHSRLSGRLNLAWAQAWSNLLSELIGDPRAALAVCEQAHRSIDFSDPNLGGELSELFSVEAWIEMRLNHLDKANALVDDWLKVAQAHNDLGEEADIWNTKATLAGSCGDLEGAFQYYQRALELSRIVGNRRREALTLHNLSTLCWDLDQMDQAEEFEQQYLALSRLIGNHLAEAYGPYVLSTIAAERGDFDRAEALLAQAERAARENGWTRQLAMVQMGQADSLFRCWMAERKPELLRQALEIFEPILRDDLYEDSEVAGAIVLVLALSGQTEKAQAALAHARAVLEVPADGEGMDQAWFGLVEAFLAGRPLDPALEWFRRHDYRRIIKFGERLKAL